MVRSVPNLVGYIYFLNHNIIKINRKILRTKHMMRLVIIIMFFSLIYITSAKSNVKTLTESMGQEVIEIGTPIKELPMGLEEEPSGENDDDDDKPKSTSNTPVPATKKDIKKTTTLTIIKKQVKDIEKIDGLNQEDEEARIEKELAEIYKDTADYKTDSAEEKEVAKEPPAEQPSEEGTSAEEIDKPIGRQRNNFKFQPDSTDSADVERFRTSVDDISCNNRQKLSGTITPQTKSNKAFNIISHGVTLITAALCYVFICT